MSDQKEDTNSENHKTHTHLIPGDFSYRKSIIFTGKSLLTIQKLY